MYIDPAFTYRERVEIIAAYYAWGEHIAVGQIRIERVDAFPDPLRRGEFDYGPNVIRLMGERGCSFYSVAIHEFGHAAGLHHIDWRPSIMSTICTPATRLPTREDIDALPR